MTGLLSPILPVAGLDIRREDYRSVGGLWEGILSIISGNSAPTPSLERSSIGSSGSPPTKLAPLKASRMSSFKPTFSTARCFESLHAISSLTLKEVTEVFQYAQEGHGFISKASSKVRPILATAHAAISAARGPHVKAADATDSLHGTFDAFQFIAAMRIFAEWRLLRLVPAGFKGYALGMSLGHKDVVQNIAKIEISIHQWLEHHDRHRESDDMLEAPTLHQLLQHEIDMGEHKRLPHLKENSAGMGLLWTRRQIQYQAKIFENLLRVPEKFATARDAVSDAYSQIYDRYHGWAVQKIFIYSFQAAPGPDRIILHMNPERLTEIQKELQTTSFSFKTRPKRARQEKAKPGNPLATTIDHIGGEWHKLTNFVRGIGNKIKNSKKTANMADTPVKYSLVARATEEQEISKETKIMKLMEEDAYTNVATFLSLVNPILDDLAALFQALNMDDPTKV